MVEEAQGELLPGRSNWQFLFDAFVETGRVPARKEVMRETGLSVKRSRFNS